MWNKSGIKVQRYTGDCCKYLVHPNSSMWKNQPVLMLSCH